MSRTSQLETGNSTPMAITALNSAATGLRALSTRIDVVANNLANAETNGFKRSKANFEDLLYVTLRQPGTLNANNEVTPAGIQVGLGTKLSNTELDFSEGSLEETNVPLNVAIEGGTGFFRVKVMDGVGDGYGYTRLGNFFKNKDGELVLGNRDGYRLDPPITMPQNVTDDAISVAPDGTVSYTPPGQTNSVIAGNIKLYRFVNPQGLKAMGSSFYQSTDASGAALESDPGQDGAGQTRGGYLEGSNVDPVKELVTLIKTQRSFELNSQSIQTADQALQTIANLRRF
ncbi:MAG: flagellar basal-body rod protein FlgG [Tepidisphaeraceae bacterium]